MSSEGCLAEVEVGQDILAQDLTGMRRLESRSLGDGKLSLHDSPPAAHGRHALHPTRKRSASWRGWLRHTGLPDRLSARGNGILASPSRPDEQRHQGTRADA